MADFRLSARAFSKILLHAVKYPHCSVNGVFLRKLDVDKNEKVVQIVDAIPLFHISLTLSPMVEVALSQIEAYCKSKGLHMCGYYHAHEHLESKTPNLVAIKIAERIQEQCKDFCLIMVNNEKLSLQCDQQCLQVYRFQEGKWKDTGNKVDIEEEAEPIAASLMHTKMFLSIVDFDNHLDDIAKDWTNMHINEQIEYAT